ncbi:MAG TPA: hypothetical protein VK982_04645 [Bacteroidales bacterium]|nr:hypothetical protein [Bacteroidales bacterium]
MYNHWRKDLKDSIIALESIKNTILPKLIGGEIHSIEDSENSILIKMDVTSGIDYIRENETGLQGIAARVQWGNDWDTFTIRSKRHTITGTDTELKKRLSQIDEGYFYPAFTLQAYFDNRQENNLLSIAVIRTVDLYSVYLESPHLFESNKSDNEFIFIRWNKISKYIKRYPKIMVPT